MSSSSILTSYLTSYSGTSSSTSTSSSSSSSTLTMDDFITLLVAQMQNQDMYNTMDSTETISQLAQFSMVSSLSELSDQVEKGNSFNLIGKGATVYNEDDGTVMGVIDGVTYWDGEVEVVIDGTSYSIDDVVEVYDSSMLDS